MHLKKAALTGLCAASLLLGSLHLSNAAWADEVITPVPVNYVVDGDFEGSDASRWLFEGAQASAIAIKAQDNHTVGGSHSAAYWSGSDFHFKVSQRIEGLANGRYMLKAYTQGGGGETSSRLFAVSDGGEPVHANFINTGYNNWQQPQITHINLTVTNGSCTIGFEVDGKANNWGSIDDISLVRIGDVETAPVSMTVQPIHVTSWLNALPALPSVVSAVYNDDQSYLEVPVQWETSQASDYNHVGVYQRIGTIQGSDTTVPAIITVNLKSADLNADGVVNVADLALAYYDFNVSRGSVNWERAQKADLNNDGIVDLNDVQLMANQMIQPLP
ncbi:hypothetical protein A8709_18930 [Paenibacillus pectinilyticus]|uniref:Bacterial Ig-like domain-containing protein n=1 Tax=Paenibacillus pectinilyticus TaxID=512399 RepID=A0A1C0ZZV3_9BACL|nr:Ig-like domain-containing protein [Paenibacillus pectinilyticus]OCT13663.1 hypothetical protein A8709_18930 [Paenibacillus pectinilyticus]